jgi:hypothetical protein
MHIGGGGGGRRCPPHVPPKKDFEKLNPKNATKYKNTGLHPIFSHNPKYPHPQNNLKMTVHLLLVLSEM